MKTVLNLEIPDIIITQFHDDPIIDITDKGLIKI